MRPLGRPTDGLQRCVWTGGDPVKSLSPPFCPFYIVESRWRSHSSPTYLLYSLVFPSHSFRLLFCLPFLLNSLRNPFHSCEQTGLVTWSLPILCASIVVLTGFDLLPFLCEFTALRAFTTHNNPSIKFHKGLYFLSRALVALFFTHSTLLPHHHHSLRAAKRPICGQRLFHPNPRYIDLFLTTTKTTSP